MATMNDCWVCIHKRDVPGNCHIQCANPDRKMTGNDYGIRNGWFMYPFLFDPVWATKKCDNFELNTAMVKKVLIEE